MKIIRDGNILERITKSMRFECRKCRCVFECEKGEYQVVSARYGETEYKCECPYCKEFDYVSHIAMRSVE